MLSARALDALQQHQPPSIWSGLKDGSDSSQLGGEFHCHVHCFFKYSMFTKNHFNCSDRAIPCLPLALLIPTEEQSIPDTYGGTWVLHSSVCVKRRKRKLLPVYLFPSSPSVPSPHSGYKLCYQQMETGKKQKSCDVPPPHPHRGLAGKLPSLGQSLRLPKPLKKCHEIIQENF